jgi:hypothetical protein
MSKDNENNIDRGCLKGVVQLMLGEVKPEEMIEKLEDLALKIVRDPNLNMSMSNKDGVFLTIVEMLESGCYGTSSSLDRRKKIIFILKELYDGISKKQFPESKGHLAEKLFRFWTPDERNGDYYPFSEEIFSMMNEVYDSSDEKGRKALDDSFKRYLSLINWETAERWITERGTTEGLGTHLAKQRAREGGFKLALRDIKYARFLDRGLSQLTLGGFDSLKKAYDDICDWDALLVIYCEEMREWLSEAGHNARFEISYDYPKKIRIVYSLNIPAGNISLAGFKSLTEFADKKLNQWRTYWYSWIEGRSVKWPEITIEVFEREDCIGSITM